MCSSMGGQLARICRAIEELAAHPGADLAAATASGETAAPPRVVTVPDGTGTPGDVAARLAAIWEMVAEADPELAKRLPGYLSAAE